MSGWPMAHGNDCVETPASKASVKHSLSRLLRAGGIAK